MIDLSKFHEGFFEEAREHAAAMERDLLLLERQPTDSEILNQVFRAAHSIKGAAGTLGFAAVAEFTHAAETLLDLMRHGTLPVCHERITSLLQATDEIRRLILDCENARAGSSGNPALLARMTELSRASVPVTSDDQLHAAAATALPRDVEIAIAPVSKFFASGLDPILIFRDLHRLGTVRHVACDLNGIPQLSDADPELCYLSWTVLLHTSARDDDIRSTFMFVEDVCSVTLAPHDEEAKARAETPKVTRIKERAEAPSAARTRELESSTLRVTAEKVDAIIDLVGELVIAQSMVRQLVNESTKDKSPLLRDALESMSRNMQDLQERVMGIRMVPIGTLFGRFSRMVRDTAAELGKTVQLRIEGQETEIDKAVVERLVDPLTHLMRNAIDHGIETDDERRSLGKTEPAEVCLLARHVAGGVVIQISENGRGLDTQKIRAKAELLKMIEPGAQMTDEQIHALIFEPGFSTASAITGLSGRGVGMDVVRRCVDSLNGTITIATERGVGAAFEIRLPLTLAILDGLLLRVGVQTYVVPLLVVVESFRPSPASVKQVVGGACVALLRESSLPLIDLGTAFGIAESERRPEEALVVVVEADGKRVGLVVDGLIGQSQVVVKSIESHYKRVDGVLGATILGDGKVAFILDVAGISRVAWSRRTTSDCTRAA
jgi:two-component system chemotaxis sensor kinase CheA